MQVLLRISVTMCAAYAPLADQASGPDRREVSARAHVTPVTSRYFGVGRRNPSSVPKNAELSERSALVAARHSTRLASPAGAEADAAAVAVLVTRCRRVAALTSLLAGPQADRLGADRGVRLEALDQP